MRRAVAAAATGAARMTARTMAQSADAPASAAGPGAHQRAMAAACSSGTPAPAPPPDFEDHGYEAAIATLSKLITLPPTVHAGAAGASGGVGGGQQLQNDGFSTLREKWMPLLAAEAERARARPPGRRGVDVTQASLRALRVIHVAGTKGKGSTCAMLERVLRECGYKTGLFTSPHLLEVTERFRIDGAPVDRRVFSEHFWQMWRVLHAGDRPGAPAPAPTGAASPFASGMPGYFRFLTLLAFHIFTSAKVDVAILEVGLGGRLDATNVVDRPLVSGITLLDYDHTEILGDTLTLIAREKAGIMKDGVNVVTVRSQAAETMDALAEAARGRAGCRLSVAAPLREYRCEGGGADGGAVELGLAGEHQRDNAALAVSLLAEWFDAVSADGGVRDGVRDPDGDRRRRSRACADMLRAAPGERALPAAVVRGLGRAHWPGRCEIVEVAPRGRDGAAPPLRFFLDGAHTAESVRACADWFRAEAGAGAAPAARRRRVLVFHCMTKRDPMQLFGPLVALHADMRFSHVLFVPRTSPRAASASGGRASGPPPSRAD